MPVLPPRKAAAILEALDDKDAPVLQLLALCNTDEYAAVWDEGPQLARRFARRLLSQGHPTFALETASRALAKAANANDGDLLYSRARALVNSGNTTRGEQVVRALLDRGDLTADLRSDALSLAGRIRKDLAARTADADRRRPLLRGAFALYRQAYQLKRDTFPGINAASLALLAGEPDASRALAAEVRDAALGVIDLPENRDDYWLAATLGEAYLLLGDATAAKTRYGQAVRLARAAHQDGDVASMRRQLLLLREHLPVGPDLLGLFDLGPVVVFAGHAIDRPGDPVRFPADERLEQAVRRAIKHELDALEPTIGYCSPGCGSDLLFAELMAERNAEVHAILPFAEDDFRSERLTYGLPELDGWRRRYELLRQYRRVIVHSATTEEFLNDQVLYDFAGSFLQGLALTRAHHLGIGAVAVVVQDPTPFPGPSGLATFVANWERRTGTKPRTIDLAALREPLRLAAGAAAAAPAVPRPLRTPRRAVRAMLFADVAGFSGLPEADLPTFFLDFLGLVSAELKQTPPLFANTWGDGLYVVFQEVVPCADFALRLLRRLEEFDFPKHGFHLEAGKEPGIRIGLHTGPVFQGKNPILAHQEDYFGSHVSRAARIEPVTAPGCAFVSEQFAAALTLEPGHDFECEYLGLTPLAKNYDVCPLYRLTTRTDRALPPWTAAPAVGDRGA